jgi:dynein heavy chain
MFDNFLDFSTSVEGTFTTFLEIVPSFQYDKELSYFQLIVPTKSTVCYNYFVTKFIDIKSHIFITGVTGTGKTIMSENTLQLL